MKKMLIKSLALMCAVSAMQSAFAQWPAGKPITIIVPYSSGGSLDMTTRLIAQRLADRLGAQIVVENATGAGGSVGIMKAMAANPDGFTLLMAGDAPLNTNAPKEAPLINTICCVSWCPLRLLIRPQWCWLHTRPLHPKLYCN
jgi:tripartite-type tricarboxylate transporter receptor subunit TctC